MNAVNFQVDITSITIDNREDYFVLVFHLVLFHELPKNVITLN